MSFGYAHYNIFAKNNSVSEPMTIVYRKVTFPPSKYQLSRKYHKVSFIFTSLETALWYLLSLKNFLLKYCQVKYLLEPKPWYWVLSTSVKQISIWNGHYCKSANFSFFIEFAKNVALVTTTLSNNVQKYIRKMLHCYL